MGDDDARHAHGAFEFDDELVDAVGADGVEPGGGFVVEHDAGFEDDGAGKGDAFALTARKLSGQFFLDSVEVNGCERLRDLFLSFRGGELGVLDEGEGDVLGDGHGIEERAHLEEQPDLEADGAQLALAEGVDTPPVEVDFT